MAVLLKNGSELARHETEFEAQAQEMAKAFIEKMHWNSVSLGGSGQLQNGNWVFTLTQRRPYET